MTLLTPAQYVEAILSRGYHLVTANEMARSLRADLDSCPKRTWDELRPEYTYLSMRPAWTTQEVFRLIEFSPSKRQAWTMRHLANGEWLRDKIYRGRYLYSTLTELSAPLISLLGVSHRDVLETAIEYDLSQDIPGVVRRGEPDLFVPIPERFDVQVPNRCGGGADRLRDTLSPAWGHPVTVETLTDSIAAAHEQIAAYHEWRFRAATLNPKVAADYDQYIADAMETIDWLRWVEELIEPGGVFAISP